MSELMLGNWVDCKLGDVASIIRGVTFPASSKVHEPADGYVACLRTSHVQEKLLWDNIYYVPQSHVKRADQLVGKNDILMSMANSSNLVGKVCINETDRTACFGAFLSAIRSKEIDHRYVYYYLKSSEAQQALKASASQTVNIANISVGTLENLRFPLPPLAEQTRIAAKLDELLAQVDTLKARIDGIPALLKRFRQSVLAAAVSGRLTEEWRSSGACTDTGPELHQQIKAAHAAEGGHARGNASNPTEEAHDLSADDLPACWDIAELRDICVPGRPITYGILKPGPELDEGVPYIRVADFPGNKLNMANIKKTSAEIDEQFRRARLMAGDLLLSIRGSVGRLIKIPAALEGANITQDTARLAISPLVSTDFVYWALLADSTQRRMKNATRGVAVRGINIGDVRALQIPLPSRDEQTEIVRRVEQLFAFADQLEAKVASAKSRIDHLTQSILAKAFRGELVPQDPNDEPASLLLERIKAQRAAAPKAKRGRKASA
ncbi:restriction endonuclease subunit S [Stutzerimonas kunmingensis]|uniref:restriction endonuclease subunit S n=1 Tax=Stutzerimonas kunmingensis TaxID=1211807 RepID=UPI0028A70D35|nr:restriction endonuclease subunit S [Stutzerimonas kunmingensis]